MLMAITRSPGPELIRCELTHLERQPIDFERARAQHTAYRNMLRAAGSEVVELPADPALPDGLFVEDTAIILNEVAVLLSPTPASRRGESAAVEAALRPFRPIVRLPADAFVEGGDVLRVGRTLFIGQSSRTGQKGLLALAEVVGPLGYTVVPVRVTDCLHLKSACCALDEETVIVNRDWLDFAPLAHLRVMDTPASEPGGANVLRLPDVVVISASFPRTLEVVQRLGFATDVLDVSELHKAESGLTCMSLVFEASRSFHTRLDHPV